MYANSSAPPTSFIQVQKKISSLLVYVLHKTRNLARCIPALTVQKWAKQCVARAKLCSYYFDVFVAVAFVWS